jgi:hypothetical protein
MVVHTIAIGSSIERPSTSSRVMTPTPPGTMCESTSMTARMTMSRGPFVRATTVTIGR